MRRFHLRISTALILTAVGVANAQVDAPDLKIDRVTLDDGLPTLPVTHAMQDGLGFVWLSTWDGLYRFDGYSYRGYRHDPDDSTSISSDWVTSTAFDADGRQWVATNGGGLNRFDQATGRFETFTHDADDQETLSSNEIGWISLMGDGMLWLTSSNGVNRFDPRTTKVTRFVPDPDDSTSLTGAAVRALLEDSRGRIWVGTGNPFVPKGVGALNLMDRRAGTFQSFQILPSDPTSLLNFIQAIVELDDGNLLVAPWAGGIYTFDVDSQTFSHFADPLRLDDDSPDAKVVKLARQEGTPFVWVGTYGAGLQRLDLLDGSFARYTYDATNPFTIPDDRVWEVLFDEAGSMWIGTHGGLARTTVVGRLPRVRVDGLSADDWVTDILEASDGRLWLATDRNALISWDRTTKTSRRHRMPTVDCAGWKFPGVGLTQSTRGNLWVVGPCGLFSFDPKAGAFERVRVGVAGSGVGSDQAIRVIEDARGMVWIASQPAVIRVDPRELTHTVFSHDPEKRGSLSSLDVEDVLADQFGRLWVGTAAGVDLFDPNTSQWTHTPIGRFDESSAATSLIDGLNGTLWVTTDRDGLVRFHPRTENEEFFGIKEGLHSNTLMRSVVAHDGSVWVLSPTGLSVIDPETRAVRRFNTLDGLVDVRFGKHDMAALSDGSIAVGGRGMMNLFDAEEYGPPSNPPSIVIDEVRARGQFVYSGKVRSDDEMTPFVLRHDENDLVFEYVGLRVANPSQIDYAYQLEGLDEGWVEVGGERTARYQGLSPGSYVFRVRGATGSGKWSDAREVAFSIRPPWWLTGWAYVLYLGIVVGGMVLIVRQQTRRIVRAEQQLARQKELEQARDLKRAYEELEQTHKDLKETQARLDEMKSRFFANISHEFRTPLTLILGQAEALLATADDGDRKKLEMLSRNGRHLLRLINQLLDLSAIEGGGMELQPESIDVIAFFRNLVGSFESLAQRKGVVVAFTPRISTLHGRFERDKLEKIFLNLISNAIKFTSEGGVTVSLETRASDGDASLIVTVTDTGFGIPADRLPYIFDRFYQVGSTSRRPHEGTGIGLALVKELVLLHQGTIEVDSEVGRGTTFTVALPLEVSEPTVSTDTAEPGDHSVVRRDVGESNGSLATPRTADDAREIVLVVEDNPDVRSYLADSLTDAFSVFTAATGSEGLERAIAMIPDLIITDVMMPEMDGFELARALRTDQRSSHIPIIMLTARAGTDDRIEGLETGIDDYLIKPFSPRELRVRVRNLIEQRKMLRARFSTATRITPSDVSAVSVEQEFVQNVLASIESHVGDEDFSVDALAKEIGMSVSQLNRKLGALVDQSAGRLIRSMRLQRAADLLVQNAGTVAEIAYLVGFGSHATFSAAFKKQFGVSPTDYSTDPSSPT